MGAWIWRTNGPVCLRLIRRWIAVRNSLGGLRAHWWRGMVWVWVWVCAGGCGVDVWVMVRCVRVCVCLGAGVNLWSP